MSPELAAPDVEALRAHFPALSSGTVFFENAGGSQVPIQVADRARRYMLESYVNTGAGYEASKRATQNLKDAHTFVNRFMGGEASGGVALGASTSQLLRMLADAYEPLLRQGDEIVIAASGHEANINPWLRLERAGVRIVFWPVDPACMQCTLEGLDAILSERTRLVLFPHASNLLGEIVDAAEIARRAHAVGAEVVVDGVAYAPHAPMDVEAVGADWYIYSTYKVFGPHMAALWGRKDAWQKLEGPNHFFIPKSAFPGKFELGCPNHEGCAAILGLGDYICDVLGCERQMPRRDEILHAWRIFQAAERPLQAKLLAYLRTKRDVRVIGPAQDGPTRIGIVSFVHTRYSPAELARYLDEAQIGARHGHAYAYRLCEGLGLDPEQGVLRVSFCHYNTVQEVDRLIDVLDPHL